MVLCKGVESGLSRQNLSEKAGRVVCAHVPSTSEGETEGPWGPVARQPRMTVQRDEREHPSISI
ncbi:hypothetical protein I79_005158 [Cricetulus griseus]|uniref:Uncharacterized protein n=1 Tax=Cricetulus griseus TaxID=10029 RepID=G3H4F7_CRIGR|nr:hypothetical protein I79_005158 [Cricetulus griseus]